jgi:hypothetical protein
MVDNKSYLQRKKIQFLVRSMLLILLCFVLSYYVSLRSEFCFVMSYYVSLRSEFCFVMFLNTIFGSFLPPVVCGMFYVLFTRFVFASALWCPTPIVLCFVLFFLVLCTSFSGLSSFDCPFGIL